MWSVEADVISTVAIFLYCVTLSVLNQLYPYVMLILACVNELFLMWHCEVLIRHLH